MTDKKGTLLVIIEHLPADLSDLGRFTLDQMVKDGNSQLLALRKATVEEPFGIFEAVLGLSAVSASSDLAARLRNVAEQSRIEQGFFGNGSQKSFSELFHRKMRTAMVTTSDQIAQHAADFGISTVAKESLMEAFIQVPELLILHTETLSAADLDLIEAIRADSKFTIQFVMGPVAITKATLLPAQEESLPFARPKQSFERFGPIELPLDQDICETQALVVIENDKNFCRVDQLQSFDELVQTLGKMAEGDKTARLFGHLQLADTLIRQVGFKLGKVDKFGA